MIQTRLATWDSALLISVPVLFLTLFSILAVVFDYPGILRQPTDSVLTRFASAGPSLVALWYGAALAALLLIPMATLVYQSLGSTDWPALMGLVAGILAGTFQLLGFLRWSFLVPSLSAAYIDPQTTEASKQAIAVVLFAFHQFLGVGVGEHLGYLTTAIWTALVAHGLQKAGILGMGLTRTGQALGIGIACGLLEPGVFSWAGMVNAMAYTLWAPWFVVVGVIWLRRSSAPA